MSSQIYTTFGRTLPSPFESIPQKSKVASKYSDGTVGTLHAGAIKAFTAYCKALDGSAPGAIGEVDGKTVVEYKSSNSADEYHLAVYDSATGSIMGSVFDKNLETMEKYTVSRNGRDGAVIFFALIQHLMQDEEFKDTFGDYYEEYRNGFPDVEKAAEHAAILCDNAYRRIEDNSCPAYVKIDVSSTGNLMMVSNTHLDSGRFKPTTVFAGEFTIFAQVAADPEKIVMPNEIEHSDFIGQYRLSERKLSAKDQAIVPELPDWYVIPEEAVNVCLHASKTTATNRPMRNFMLRGPSGTGKTEGSKAIASGLGLPYVHYTCNANTEIQDITVQVLPVTDENKELSETGIPMTFKPGEITFENVRRQMKLPDNDDIIFDPIGSYQMITGFEKPDATSKECLDQLISSVTSAIDTIKKSMNPGSSDSQRFVLKETAIIEAFRYGFVLELQEPSVILQPGVLVGLNSLLDSNGSIRLPTGETLRRHPDTVVVLTTNVNYEGCRPINQSVIDRMSMISDIELPPRSVMAQRIMKITGYDDDEKLMKMIGVIEKISEYCKKSNITDGSCGIRSLIDWVLSTMITEDPYKSALHTVISKATSDVDEQYNIRTTILDNEIPSAKRKHAS